MAEPTDYDEFVSQILRPTNLDSLRDSSKHIVEVVIHHPEDEPEELVFDDLYPFYTIGELLIRIYMEKQELKYHPQNVCLLLANDEDDESAGYSHFQFSQIDGDNKPVFLINPFERVKGGIDSIFVNEDGSSTRINTTNREQFMLESTLFHISKDSYRIHLFSYLDLLELYPGERDSIGKKDWNGKFRPYFPSYPRQFENSGELSDEVASYTEQRIERFTNKTELVNSCNNLLQTKSLKKPGNSGIGDPLSFIHFRNLRFLWKPITVNEDEYERFDLETIFYDTPVSEFIPYIRFYSTHGSPLSKVYVVGPANIPGMEDPDVLLQWATESSLTPNEDLVMIKFMVHPSQGNIPPLYGTFFVFSSGHAKMILQPNEGQKLLSPQTDLLELSDVMTKLTDSIPKLKPKVDELEPTPLFTASNASLDDAYIVLSLTVESFEPKISAKQIGKVLPYFQPFFQITTSPLDEQRPIAYLRFKLVDNFRIASRDFHFLRRMMDIQKVKGISAVPLFVKQYEEEFNVPHDVAVKRVKDFLDDSTNMEKTVVEPLETDYVQANNPGLDIAIFEKHPLYTFHTYRIDSLRALVQIKTLLSLLISTTPDDFGKSDAYAAKDEEEEDEIEQEEANKDASLEINTGLDGSPALNAKVAQVTSDKQSFGDLFDDFDDFGDEAPVQTQLVTTHEEKLPSRKELFEEEKDIEADIQTEVKEKKKKSKKKKGDEEDEEEDFTGATQDLKKLPVKRYFLRRLKNQDKKLFDWDAEGFEPYPRKCQARDLRQPIAITEEDYKRMKLTYTDDITKGDVQFIDFPFSDGEKIPKKPHKDTEVITTLRYGTKLPLGQANIYLCSEFWCRNDEIVVLRKDFYANEDRNKNFKEKETCPFCKKGLVKSDAINPNEAVIRRAPEIRGKILPHLAVRFLKEGAHPDNFGVPCCFLKAKDEPIFQSNPFFTEPFKKKQKGFFTTQQTSLTNKPGDVVEILREGEKDETMPVDIQEQLQDIRTAYIVGAEKFPLSLTKKLVLDKDTKKQVIKYVSQVGILQAPVERYFSQSAIPQLVRQEHANWKIITDFETQQASVSGFFRVGVDNTKTIRTDSFFSALAPYYSKKSAEDMKQMFRDLITPQRFLALNYGNFLFDFYSPSIEKPDDKLLQDWVKLNFKTSIETGEHKESFIRLYKAYNAFLDSFEQKQLYKEYRQYAHVLAQNNMFLREERTNGLLVIMLEVNKGSVQIRCPPYGVTQYMMDTCDIAFITYNPEYKIWEPVFYTNNNVEENIHENLFYFTQETKDTWPSIVQQRVQEYFGMCKSSGLGVYTEIPNVQSEALIPLSIAMKIAPVSGILRDINNHVSNILFQEGDSHIVVPVIDDGLLYDSIPVLFDWNQVYEQVADSQTTRVFYETKLYPIIKENPLWLKSYEITEVVRLNNPLLLDNDGYAFHLGNTFFIPIKAPEKGESFVEYTRAKSLPWMIDRETVFAEIKPSVQASLDSKELNEIYQHLRFTFSNWLANEASSMIKEIGDVIENPNIPLFEKRQALRIKLEKTITSWLEPTVEYNQRKPSVKRVDCRVIRNPDDCTNRCSWKEEGVCALHVPEETQLGHSNVKVIPLLIHRLFEELIRFPMKRDELLLQKVSKYQILTDAFRSGNEYIIPEHIPAWTELLRMQWRIKESEQPKHYEEFSTYAPKEIVQQQHNILAPAEDFFPKKVSLVTQSLKQPIVQPTPLTQPIQSKKPTTKLFPVPPSLKMFLGNKSETLFFHPIVSVLEVFCEMGLNLFEFTETFSVQEDIPFLQTKEQLEYVGKEIKKSIFQIMFEKDDPIKPKVLILETNQTGGVEPQASAIVFIQTPDGELGTLSFNVSGAEPIPISQLPLSLKHRLKYATKINLP